MRRGRAVAVVMGMAMAVMMTVGIGWNHPAMLYYNITSAKPFDKPFKTLGPPDCHCWAGARGRIHPA
jgi:hypothetical protein